jgi:hypothetical protein
MTNVSIVKVIQKSITIACNYPQVILMYFSILQQWKFEEAMEHSLNFCNENRKMRTSSWLKQINVFHRSNFIVFQLYKANKECMQLKSKVGSQTRKDPQ